MPCTARFICPLEPIQDLCKDDTEVKHGREEGQMERPRQTTEQIIGKLREAEVALAKGQTMA